MCLALVEYLEPSEARQGFDNLSYSKFKHLPLYLEWAPDDSLDPASVKNKSQNTDKKTAQSSSQNKKEVSNQEEQMSNGKIEKTEEKDESEDEEEPEDDTTLFIKNLNFSTTDEQLKKVQFFLYIL